MSTLSIERQKQIEYMIDSVLSQHDLSYPKNSLLDIAKALGAEVYFADLPESETEGVSGVIEWSDAGKPNIIINDSFSPERSTFTLAHELGHLLIHPNEKKNRIDTYDYSVEESLDETEANFFAATLLMPRIKFQELVSLTNNINAVAEYFGVSESAAQNRLLWLKSNILQ